MVLQAHQVERVGSGVLFLDSKLEVVGTEVGRYCSYRY